MIWELLDIPDQKEPSYMMTENETNDPKLFNSENYSKFYKDAFHLHVTSSKHYCICYILCFIAVLRVAYLSKDLPA